MMKSKRLEPIREIASNAADSLQPAVATAGKHLAEMERQLEQLLNYRADYVSRSERAPGSVDAVRLQNFRSFLGRLTDAIRLQKESVEAARADYEAKRQQWSAKRVEAEALGKAVERFRVDERRAQDRRDQHESDEASLRRATSRETGTA